MVKEEIVQFQQPALRAGDALYPGLSARAGYTLPDPTSISLAVADANGDEAGYLLYDAYGGVLTDTLSEDLTEALAGQGAVANPDTGLVYGGQGRFYDPALGRPLQPNPLGGPPTVPQALNRYAATSLGPRGVAEGFATLAGGTFGQAMPGIYPAAPQANPLAIALRATAAQTALGYAVGEAIEATTWGRLTIIASQSTWYRTIGSAGLGLRSLFQRGVAQPQLGKTFRAYTTLGQVRDLGSGRYLVETGQIIDTTGLPASAQVRFAPLWGSGLRVTAGGVTAFGISAVFQGVEDYLFEPSLTPYQRMWRVGISGFGGLGAWVAGGIAAKVAFGAGAGSWAGPIGVGVAATVTFVWIVWIQPAVFEARGLNPPERDLAPLQN